MSTPTGTEPEAVDVAQNLRDVMWGPLRNCNKCGQPGYLHPDNTCQSCQYEQRRRRYDWPTLYRILNQGAQGWWYYKKLRADGKTEDARKLERVSIRKDVKTLRALIENNVPITYSKNSGVYYTGDYPSDYGTGTQSMSFGGYRHGNALATALRHLGHPITNDCQEAWN